MERVLVIGANGFLGRKLLPLLSNTADVFAADLEIGGIDEKYRPFSLDITVPEKIDTFFDKIAPNLVINTAAMTNVDACEDNPALAMRINAEGPRNIARGVKRCGGRMIHISTDFVFDGTKGNYIETDVPSPISVYGQSKLNGEQYLLAADIPVWICRTSVLYGWPLVGQKDNFFSWGYKSLAAGKTLQIIKGQITTPTYIDDLAFFLSKIPIFADNQIIHTAGPDSINRFDFLAKLCDIFDFNPNLVVPIEKLVQKAQRPADSSLNSHKLRSLKICSFLNIESAFHGLKAELSM